MRTFTGNESYFEHVVVIVGKGPGQSGDDMVLPAGQYVYPFNYQLPAGLPSSFEGDHGRVRYSFVGVIDRPWKFDHTCKGAFTVVDPLNLNMEPTAMQPAEGRNSKTLGCLCCTTGPISAVFRLGRLGYVPGESIGLYGEVNNGSDRLITSSYIELIMTVNYHARTRSKSVTKSLARVQHGSIDGGDTDVWNGDLLHIPPLPPSGLRGCRIIDIQYTLSLTVDPSGPSMDLVVPINILIGSIPLQAAVAQYGPPAPMGPPSDGNIQNLPSTVPSAPSMPPPSYAESALGKVDIRTENDNEHTRGNMEFAPVYTYYNWNRQTQDNTRT
ncbi:arrestin domain-containing protein 3 isoform X2 [Patella vulgata]|nr:arrestin domain-containing protein 3 isoform X2 [Patella vulgata]